MCYFLVCTCTQYSVEQALRVHTEYYLNCAAKQGMRKNVISSEKLTFLKDMPTLAVWETKSPENPHGLLNQQPCTCPALEFHV